MIEEDTIITLDDDTKYYVLDSLMYNNFNYLMIGEMDTDKDEITNKVKYVYYDSKTDMIKKITDPNAFLKLTKLFANKMAGEE